MGHLFAHQHIHDFSQKVNGKNEFVTTPVMPVQTEGTTELFIAFQATVLFEVTVCESMLCQISLVSKFFVT